MTKDVVVIGAGMAGLTAARALAEAGRRVVVVEAQERIGGRIYTEHLGSDTVELGAEFVHGRPAELWGLIEEAGLEIYEGDGVTFAFEDGELHEASDAIEEQTDPIEALKNFDGEDVSFREYAERLAIPQDRLSAVCGYVEGFNAADAGVISVKALGVQQKAEDAIEGYRVFRVRGGYDQVTNYLAERLRSAGGEIVTGACVREIRWQRGEATVLTSRGEFVAPQVVVTLPLGVLERGAVKMEPEPIDVMEAAAKMRMGQARRISLLFREAFWREKTSGMGFLLGFSEIPPVWWTMHPEESLLLTGWVGGTRVRSLETASVEDLKTQACEVLGRIFGRGADELRALVRCGLSHDWGRDPLFGGSYSYVAAGGVDASRQMSEPVEGTLYFAGEHTDVTGHWGTVHGAMRSGLRVAAQVLAG